GQLAAAGYNVLLLDLNRQANLADDLGYRDTDGIDDAGAGLLTALVGGTSLKPVTGVRPNLHVVPGGKKLEDLTPLLLSRFQNKGRAAFLALAEALAPIAPNYDVVLIDSPPENTILVDLALAAARWVIMPTKSDTGGLVGMRLVAERFALAREVNPQLGLLGVVLFATGTGATAIHAEVRRDVTEAFGGQSPVFSATIRHSERVGRDSRKLGKLAHELEVAAAHQPAWWEALRRGEKTARISSTAASVSADYQELATEVLQVLAAAEQDQDGRHAAAAAGTGE
ncbi:MAG: chromosome partitioning protein, partial [Cryptosporangiaceae bacterium]|nr:chromosome partitioning protein [Cryptosporangiaceae bacterium]